MRRALLPVAGALLAACGGSPMQEFAADGTPLVAGFHAQPPPSASTGFQLVSPAIANFPPGGNTEFCYWTKMTLAQETAIKAGQGFQAPGGHHVVVYWTQKPQPEQLRECTEADMVDLHVLTGGGAEAGNGIINGLPAGTAFHVPAGAQLVMNIHALNASTRPVDTQAIVNLFYGEPGLAPVSSFYVTGTTMKIPPGQPTTYDASCVLKKDMSAVRLLGHMHEWGTRMQITVTPAGSTSGMVVYDKPGAADFSFNPPYLDYPVDAPVVIHAGDTITASCTWMNTTGKTLYFPDEMCAAFGYVLGNDPEAGCADGTWNN